MKDKKNILKALLIVVALAVWIHNGYEFVIGVKRADEPATTLPGEQRSTSVLQPDSLEVYHFTYNVNQRDPFEKGRPKPLVKRTARKIAKPVPPPVQLPNIRLIGIVEDDRGRLAVVEAPNRSVLFAAAGAQVDEVTIVAIDSASIDCRFQREHFTINLR